MNEALKLHKKHKKKIAIVIVAYNAEKKIKSVLNRIPESIWDKCSEVIIFDDASLDSTVEVAQSYKKLKKLKKLTIVANEINLGYGGNQKKAYQYAIDKGYDIAAMVHGDGQYAPECLPTLLEPLETGEADAVFGSRMMEKGSAIKGGMPYYKFVGNKVLTNFENFALGTDLSEFHSGYRLYSLEALKRVPFQKNTNDFHFDTEIIIQFAAAKMKIVEIPIPTFYGDEVCHVNGLKYAKDIFLSIIKLKAHEYGIENNKKFEVIPRYSIKKGQFSSHSIMLSMLPVDSSDILDFGCGDGTFARELQNLGHKVTGVDQREPDTPIKDFIQIKNETEITRLKGRKFKVIILGDILEHLVTPEKILEDLKNYLQDEGFIIISLPNVVHWSMRGTILMGKFEYTNQGILDKTHLRFYTKKTAEQMFKSIGLEIVDHKTTTVPWEKLFKRHDGFIPKNLEKIDNLFSKLNGNLFAYQNVFKTRKCKK